MLNHNLCKLHILNLQKMVDKKCKIVYNTYKNLKEGIKIMELEVTYYDVTEEITKTELIKGSVVSFGKDKMNHLYILADQNLVFSVSVDYVSDIKFMSV